MSPASLSTTRAEARADQNRAGSHYGLPQKRAYCRERFTTLA